MTGSDLCISRNEVAHLSAYCAAAKQVDRSWEYLNRSQIHECRTWEQGHAVSFLGMHKSNLWYSVDYFSLINGWVDSAEEEVGLPGQPAEGEGHHNHHQHLDHLG
jgi:hypothetical protein